MVAWMDPASYVLGGLEDGGGESDRGLSCKVLRNIVTKTPSVNDVVLWSVRLKGPKTCASLRAASSRRPPPSPRAMRPRRVATVNCAGWPRARAEADRERALLWVLCVRG